MKQKTLLLSGAVASLLMLVGASPVTNLDVQYGSVTGKVTGPDGKPAESIIVRIMAGGPQAGGVPNNPIGNSVTIGVDDVVTFGRGESTVATAKTDATGSYTIAKVRTGKFKAIVSMARYKPASAGVEIEAGKTATVNFTLEAK